MRETKRAYGWPEDAQFLVPDGVKEHFAARRRQPRRRAPRRVGGAGSPTSRRPTLAAEIDADAAARSCPTAGTPRSPASRPTRRGSRPARPRNQVENAIAARVPWLLAGSADLTDSTSVRLDFDGAVDFEPGTFDGRQLHFGIREHEAAAISQRPLALEAAPALVDLPHLLRLRPPGDPALGADGAAGDPRLHPRLDRPRRGRPDPPAGRAAGLAAGDPRPRRDPARRRQRGRRGLAGGDRPHPPAGRPGPHPPERAGPRPLPVRLGRGAAARRLRARRRRRRRPRGDPDRDRQRGRAGGRRARGAERRRRPLARRQPALLGALRPPGRRLPRRGPAAAVTARVSVEEASTLGWDRYVGPRGAADRDAHLRQLGAAARTCRPSSASRRTGSRRPGARCWREQTATDGGRS